MRDPQSEKSAAYSNFLIQGMIFLILFLYAHKDPAVFFMWGAMLFFISIPVFIFTVRLTYKGWMHYLNSGESDIKLTILGVLSACAVISFTIFLGYAPSWFRQLTSIAILTSGVASVSFSLIWFISKIPK